jgi:YjbE family integral membrane protein
MTDLFSVDGFVAFLQVVIIDLSLAGDNAILVGMAAAGLPPEQRRRAITVGMVGAASLLVVFAGMATQLLKVVGLLFAGGILLLWVCWKMWREIQSSTVEQLEAVEALTGYDINVDGKISGRTPRKTLGQAAWQIIVADLSMSLDNVIAVAGAAREHPFVLIFGLSLSVISMGIAASFIARLLQRHGWIAYVGLAMILYVALVMIYRGAIELQPIITAAAGFQ